MISECDHEAVFARAAKWHDDETLGGPACQFRRLEMLAFVAGYRAACAEAQPVDNVRITSDGAAAVDPDYYWRDMATCPRAVKVQLLNEGCVAIYGLYDGSDPQWRGWAPVPKVRKP